MRIYTIILSIICAFSMYVNFKLSDVNQQIKYAELANSCETGTLLYVLKYAKNVDIREKRMRSLWIGEECGHYARTYLDLK